MKAIQLLMGRPRTGNKPGPHRSVVVRPEIRGQKATITNPHVHHQHEPLDLRPEEDCTSNAVSAPIAWICA